MLNHFDDGSNDVRRLAIECVATIEIDPNDERSVETTNSSLMATILSRLILYLEDPYLPLQPILIGKQKLSVS